MTNSSWPKYSLMYFADNQKYIEDLYKRIATRISESNNFNDDEIPNLVACFSSHKKQLQKYGSLITRVALHLNIAIIDPKVEFLERKFAEYNKDYYSLQNSAV